MDTIWKTVLWPQFGASIDMLENALVACPEELWSDRARRPEFWYSAYHTLFWLDLYLSGSVEGFAPPAPFNLDELDPRGVLPARPYTRTELAQYLAHGRRKCRATIDALSDESARETKTFPWRQWNSVELLIYNLRHVQHHTAQLNLLLRQTQDAAPDWVSRARDCATAG